MSIRDAIKLPKLVRLYDLWDEKRRGRRYPSRQDFDPSEMLFILGNVDLVEVRGSEPYEFYFRLSGSNIDEDEGFNMQGKTIDEYPLPQFREAIRRTYTKVIVTGEPDYEELDRMNEGKHLRYARLSLPLSSDGTTINMLLLGRAPLMR